MRITLIIAAGGNSTRFRESLRRNGSSQSTRSVNKLLYSLQGEPLLLRALNAFRKISQIREIIVAIPKDVKTQMKAWQKKYAWRNVQCVLGGTTRAESVLNALKKASRTSDWIMVHDGARPFVNQATVEKMIERSSVGEVDGLILAKKVVPTIKRVEDEGTEIEKTVDRKNLYEAETPQLVRREVLEKAYQKNLGALECTDESALLESVGAKVQVFAHENWNPKITTAQDLELANAYLTQGKGASQRVGFGKDTHRLILKRKLYLGGLHIPFEKGALGHSDGDALLHAICDAILGATGEGDIGDHFSDKNKKFKGIRSEKILRSILEKVRSKGWTPAQVDTVIVLEKPRLGAYKKMIKTKIAKLLNLEESFVSVKAKTLEGLGPEGQGLAVTCEALIVMKRIVS